MVDNREKSRFSKFADHPRTNLIAALIVAGASFIIHGSFGYFLWASAAVLILRSAWELPSIRTRFHFEFQSPIVRTKARNPKSLPPELGRLDFELGMNESSANIQRIMSRITKEMQKANTKVASATRRIEKSAGDPVTDRLRAVKASAKVIDKFSTRLEKLSADYAKGVSSYVSNSRKYAENLSEGQDLEALRTFQQLRDVFVANRDAYEEYLRSTTVARELNTSQDSNAAFDKLNIILSGIISTIDSLIEFATWAQNLVVSKMKEQK